MYQKLQPEYATELNKKNHALVEVPDLLYPYSVLIFFKYFPKTYTEIKRNPSSGGVGNQEP